MKMISGSPVMVLLTFLLAFTVLLFFSCQSSEEDSGGKSEVSRQEKSAAARETKPQAKSPESAKEKELSPPEEISGKTNAHDHEKDSSHQPCPSNFVVQPKEGEAVGQGVSNTDDKEKVFSKVERIVYITTSRACACTMKRCEKTDKLIKQMKKTYPGLPLVTINYAKETEKARKLAKRYKVLMLPIILFLEEDGSPLVKMSGEIKEEEAKKTFAQFFAKSE